MKGWRVSSFGLMGFGLAGFGLTQRFMYYRNPKPASPKPANLLYPHLPFFPPADFFAGSEAGLVAVGVVVSGVVSVLDAAGNLD